MGRGGGGGGAVFGKMKSHKSFWGWSGEGNERTGRPQSYLIPNPTCGLKGSSLSRAGSIVSVNFE